MRLFYGLTQIGHWTEPWNRGLWDRLLWEVKWENVSIRRLVDLSNQS